MSTYVSRECFSGLHWLYLFFAIWSPVLVLVNNKPSFVGSNSADILRHAHLRGSPFLITSLEFVGPSEGSFEKTQVGSWTSPKAATPCFGNIVCETSFVIRTNPLCNCVMIIIFFESRIQSFWQLIASQLLTKFSKDAWVPRNLLSAFPLFTCILLTHFSIPPPLHFMSALLCTTEMAFVWLFRFLGFTWQLFSVLVASLSTLFYVILQFLYRLLNYASDSWTYIILVKVFSSARVNMRIRFSQILYWPIFLQDNGMR